MKAVVKTGKEPGTEVLDVDMPAPDRCCHYPEAP